MTDQPLGWIPPKDRAHERRFAISAIATTAPCPVVIGIPWHASFDTPVRKGVDWWIGTGSLGPVRGGHAVCLRPPAIDDVPSAHAHYDQGREGACTGFASARAATLYGRRLFAGQPVYEEARRIDEWPGEDYDGTSVNAALNAWRHKGMWTVRKGVAAPHNDPRWAIHSFFWCKTGEELLDALKSAEPFVRIRNSWGVNYPAEVRMPIEVLDRMLRQQDGEAGVPIDLPGPNKPRTTTGG